MDETPGWEPECFELQRSDEELLRLQRRAAWTTVAQGSGVFLAGDVFFFGISALHSLTAAAAGALVGLLWLVTRADSLLSPVIAMVAFMLLQVAWLQAGEGHVLALLTCPLPVGCVSAYLGWRRSEALLE